MSKKTIAKIGIVLGILVSLISLFADLIGIGIDRFVFGAAQIAGTLLGIVLAAIGAVLYLRSSSPKE